MGRYSEETIQNVLAATDIVELVGSYFPLKRAGKDYRATCPFHTEKTPSFYVIPSKQTYHCFGCGAHGTALRFVMDYENSDFRTALRKLADRAGLTLPDDAPTDADDERARRQRARILGVLGEAARFFHQQLLDAPAASVARAYLNERGLADGVVGDWMLGYAPAAMAPVVDWAKGKGFKARDLVAAGLASPKDEDNPKAGVYARFRHRLMFPIRNDYGDVVGFSGRILDPDSKLAKYVNTPETSVFQKGRILYGLDRAKRPILKSGHAVVCEGQMDLIAMTAAGFPQAVAPLGTSLTPDHARLLRRHTESVILCYDGDAAGLKAADRAYAELARAGVAVKVVALPPGEDPDSLLRKAGAEALRAVLDSASPYLDFFFARHAGTLRTGDLAARTGVAREAAVRIACLADPLMRESCLQDAAVRLSLDAGLVRDEVRREALRLGQQDNRSAPDLARDLPPPPATDTPFHRVFASLAHLALVSLPVRQWLRETRAPEWEQLPGWDILCPILGSDADPAQAASLNAFLATLGAGLERRLLASLADGTPRKPEEAARAGVARLDELQTQARLHEIRSRLRDPSLPIDEVLRLQKLVVDLKGPLQDSRQAPTTFPVVDEPCEPDDPF